MFQRFQILVPVNTSLVQIIHLESIFLTKLHRVRKVIDGGLFRF